MIWWQKLVAAGARWRAGVFAGSPAGHLGRGRGRPGLIRIDVRRISGLSGCWSIKYLTLLDHGLVDNAARYISRVAPAFIASIRERGGIE